MKSILKNLLLLGFLLFQSNASQSFLEENQARIFDHSQYNSLLGQFVVDGKVRYKDLVQSGSELLDSYLTRIARAKNLSSLPRDEQLALYINAYNAYNLKAVVDHYPINGWNPLYPRNSIRQIPGVWKKWQIEVGRRKMSLDDLEHKIIRKFNDPRIHFAVNCASIGCPDLASYAYTGAKLQQQLEQRVLLVLTQPGKYHFCNQCDAISLCKILEWFPADFHSFARKETRKFGKYAGVIGFLINYLPGDLKARLISEKIRVKFLEYDWSLNEAP